jgi:hypothetical protein
MNLAQINENRSAARSGGGIFNYRGTVTISDGVQIHGNLAQADLVGQGGGIHNKEGTVDLTGVVVSENIARAQGGGILNEAGTLTLTDTAILANRSATGGGIKNLAAGAAAVAGVTGTRAIIRDNVARANAGGGIHNLAQTDGTALVTLTDSQVRRNRVLGICFCVSFTGGGIDSSGTGGVSIAKVALTNTVVARNIAESGGGIRNIDGVVILTDSTVDRNRVSGAGGGLVNVASGKDAIVTLNSSTVSRNEAQGTGGGILNQATGAIGRVTLNNSTVSDNSAVADGGGIGNLQQATGTAQVSANSSTIADNLAQNNPSHGILADGGPVVVRNTIVGPHPQNQDCVAVNGGTITDGGFSLESGLTCGLALSGAPTLDNLANYGGPTETRALVAGSPAIDAGNPAGCRADLNGDGAPDAFLSEDQRGSGFPRVVGVACDIGSFEF